MTQPLACGQTIGSTLSSAAQTNAYSFNANAGDVVTILVLGQTINAVAEVHDPNGARIGDATNNFTGPITLTTGGTYMILVHADNTTSTGAYGISLSFLTGGCGTPLLWGPPANGNLNLLAQVDSYTFYGNAGESVVLNATSSNLTAGAFVADPDGAIVANWVNGTTSLDLAKSGTYTVGVYSFYIGNTGTYSVSLFLSKLVPASFRLAIGATNGAALLTIWGQPGRSTTLQYLGYLAATNQWLTLTNFSLPWSPYQLVDPASANSPQRFYQTFQQ